MTSPVSSASSAAASIFSSATSSAKESPVHAAATAYAGVKSAEGFSYATVAFISLTCIITALAIIAAGVYFSGYSDDVASWWAKRYYKAKAVAEVKVLENTGVESVHSLVTGRSKCFYFYPAMISVIPLLGWVCTQIEWHGGLP